MKIGELIAFVLYFLLMIGIGVYFFLKNKDSSESSYFLGGRQMGSWVAALSASASDMSAWLLMGLPGSILVYGVCKLWIPVGLLIGTILAWVLVAPRLRRFSICAGDAITIPQYLSNRFLSKGRSLQVISAIVFLVCYAVYAASSFKACGTLFNTVLGMNSTTAIIVAAAIILVYTFLGGFNAVCWTDFFQGLLMLGAILLAPLVALGAMNLPEVLANTELPESYWNLLATGKWDWSSIATALSGLGWGLGYFGMPHILVRYMSIKSNDQVKKSRIIAICWIVLALIATSGMALVGRLFLPELITGNAEQVFIVMVRKLFPGFVAGILLSAILAASMSTADSQLLVAASAAASDIYKPLINKKASDKQMMNVSRIVVALIAVVALLIALSPNCGSIMSLVENAWAGFGSAFGPAILLSLYWKRFTYKGAVAGIFTGAVVDVLWLAFLSGPTGLYEIIPGFICSLLACIIVTKLDKKPSAEVEALFDKSVAYED